jgi:hypothetical protein
MTKTFVKFLLVSIVSMTVGGVLGWQAFSHYKIMRYVVPFDRSQYSNLCIDYFQRMPHIDFHFTPGKDTFIWWSAEGKIGQDFDSYLTRFASFSTNFQFVISFNSDVTVQQIRDIDAQIRKFGFPPSRMLIEDNRETQTGKEERLFRDIRIGVSKDINWNLKEWFIDGQQEEATKRMKCQRNGGAQ